MIIAEEPGSSTRARMRRKCKPKGPVGYLLETIHLQASAIDEAKVIHQHNQPPIDLLEAPYQHLTPMIKSAVARNRTKKAGNTREECRDLEEID